MQSVKFSNKYSRVPSVPKGHKNTAKSLHVDLKIDIDLDKIAT